MASMVAASGVVAVTATAALAASPPSCVGDQVSNCGDTIYLHNGTVQHHPRVYLIFLGPNWKNDPTLDAQAKALANNVFGRLKGSAFNHILTEYYDSSGSVATDTVLAGYDEDPTPVQSQLSEPEILSEIDKEVSAHSWSANADTQFIVIPQPGTNASLLNGCGRHFMRELGASGTAAWALNPADKSGCSNYSLTSIALHEYAEAVTDPQGLDWSLVPTNVHGWATDNPHTDPIEIADKCAGYSYQSDQYFNVDLPLLWSPADGGCVSGYGQDYPTTDPGWPFHTVYGAILGRYQALHETNSVLGEPVSEQQNAPGGGQESLFNGSSCGSGSVILWTSATGAWEMHGCIYNDYLHKSGFGGPAGQFGYPVSNEQETSTNDGRVSYMSGSPCGSNPEPHSALYFNGATWGVKGCIFAKYRSIGETASFLGYPTSLEYSTSLGIRQDFQHGYMLWANGVATPYRYGCTDYGGSTMTGPNACVGFYTTSTWFSGGGVGLLGQEIWTYANGTVKDSTANYSLSGLDTTHVMQLQAYIPNNHADASNTHYHYCSPGGGCADGYVNQNKYTNQWAIFGAVCTTDGTATIQLADDGGDAYPAQVGADAIRAVRTGLVC